ncbi:hypothetical protein [Gorillibacterium sp. CAU 1737]|uniref:hypothetical protein n=1 Tax=Gorillibacterium sp. CAU 1737 TaxID=3140362 RepID=UPI003261B858
MNETNKYIEGMKEVRLTQEEQEQLERRVVQAVHGFPLRAVWKRPVYRVGAALSLLLLLTLVLLPIWQKEAPASTSPDSRTASFHGFALTVFAQDGSPVSVQPNATFLLGQYSPAMSIAPGLPIQIAAEGADRIRVETTEGSLLFWEPPVSKVEQQGKSTDVQPGGTVYWSALVEAEPGPLPTESRLTLTAIRNGEPVGTAEVEITSEGYLYRGKLVPKDEPEPSPAP